MSKDDPVDGDLGSRRFALLVRQLRDELRAKRGWQVRVAEWLGVHRSYITRALQGQSIGLKVIGRAAGKLSLDDDFFFADLETEPHYRDYQKGEPRTRIDQADRDEGVRVPRLKSGVREGAELRRLIDAARAKPKVSAEEIAEIRARAESMLESAESHPLVDAAARLRRSLPRITQTRNDQKEVFLDAMMLFIAMARELERDRGEH